MCESLRLTFSALESLRWLLCCIGDSEPAVKQTEVRGEMSSSSVGRLVCNGEV
jgi:hypothetical protein